MLSHRVAIDLERRVDARLIGDVAGHQEVRTDRRGQRSDPPFQRLALVGERQFGALRGAGFGDAPAQ